MLGGLFTAVKESIPAGPTCNPAGFLLDQRVTLIFDGMFCINLHTCQATVRDTRGTLQVLSLLSPCIAIADCSATCHGDNTLGQDLQPVCKETTHWHDHVVCCQNDLNFATIRCIWCQSMRTGAAIIGCIVHLMRCTHCWVPPCCGGGIVASFASSLLCYLNYFHTLPRTGLLLHVRDPWTWASRAVPAFTL